MMVYESVFIVSAKILDVEDAINFIIQHANRLVVTIKS